MFITAVIIEDYYIPLVISTLLALIFRYKAEFLSAYINIILDVLTDRDNQWLLLDISFLGGMIEIIHRSGVKESIVSVFKGVSGEKLLIRLMNLSLLLSFDDYFFPAIFSTVTKTDEELRMNKEQLAFICRGASISFATD